MGRLAIAWGVTATWLPPSDLPGLFLTLSRLLGLRQPHGSLSPHGLRPVKSVATPGADIWLFPGRPPLPEARTLSCLSLLKSLLKSLLSRAAFLPTSPKTAHPAGRQALAPQPHRGVGGAGRPASSWGRPWPDGHTPAACWLLLVTDAGP